MIETPLLDSIQTPRDLKTLSYDELAVLSAEIRDYLVALGEQCGGHLASNLGVVELTLALHIVFDSPQDPFVWDVSHQCYVHKLLTDRRERMLTLRQYKGLSGFAKIDESPYDSFGAGHAGTALSAALGMAHARDLKGLKYNVVSIIGDGTLSNGMVFEALNNIENTNFICILNDNDMSISKPTGSLAKYMTQLRTAKAYTRVWQFIDRCIAKLPKASTPLVRRVKKALRHCRDLILNIEVDVLFETFGFKYLGPLDGHNIPQLVQTLNYAKTYTGPIMIHIVTKKGKGHAKAEANPLKYHGVSPSKKPSKITGSEPRPVASYSQVFGDTLCDIAKKHANLMVVTPAMAVGSGLVDYATQFPKQFVDVGIAEGHAVTYCAGLAKAGALPVLAIYSTFLQRGYDQLIHDVCLQKLPVIFGLDRAGLVGQDGPTHHGVFDYAFMLSIPNLVILSPRSTAELKHMLWWAVHAKQPVSIRYPKTASPVLDLPDMAFDSPVAEVMVSPPQHTGLVISTGDMAYAAYTAITAFNKNAKTQKLALINLRSIKPLDTATLAAYMTDTLTVIEDGVGIGGVASYIQQAFPSVRCHRIAIPDRFIDHGSLAALYQDAGLSVPCITEQLTALYA